MKRRSYKSAAQKDLKKRKRNPRDENIIKQLQIGKNYHGSDNIVYTAFIEDELICIVNYDKLTKTIEWVNIEKPEYKRKGIVSYIYDYIEKDLRIKLKPSKSLTPDGEAFWKNRLKSK